MNARVLHPFKCIPKHKKADYTVEDSNWKQQKANSFNRIPGAWEIRYGIKKHNSWKMYNPTL